MRLVEEALHDYKLEAIEKAKYDEEPEMVVKLKQAFKIFEAKK